MTSWRVVVAGAVAAVVAATALAQQQDRSPVLYPFFNTLDAPAFFVECVNDTGRPMQSNDTIWPWMQGRLRIDGQLLVETGGIIGPGLSMTIEPGGVWRGIITLHQEARPSFAPPVAFGANVRGGRTLPLAPGRHTIAVRCNDTWSDDVAFYWEGEPRGQR